MPTDKAVDVTMFCR